MSQGRSLSSENTDGATGARGMKNAKNAKSGYTCKIADAESLLLPQLWTTAALSPDTCLTCELAQLAKPANNKTNKIPSSPLVKRAKIEDKL